MAKDYLKSIDQTLKDILKELKAANRNGKNVDLMLDGKAVAKEIAHYQEHAKTLNRR